MLFNLKWDKWKSRYLSKRDTSKDCSKNEFWICFTLVNNLGLILRSKWVNDILTNIFFEEKAC